MASLVVCDNGFTYDHPTIEQHFCSRIEQEQERQQQQQGGVQSTDNTACCGAWQEIQLTSPKTNEIVLDRLLPNRNLDQWIVELVEGGHPNVTKEDIKDWKKRQEQKQKNDQIQQEEEQWAQECQEERVREGERYECINREETAKSAAQGGGVGGASHCSSFALCASVRMPFVGASEVRPSCHERSRQFEQGQS
eukprot:12975459-Ditylum_brightwellii.AAC.1